MSAIAICRGTLQPVLPRLLPLSRNLKLRYSHSGKSGEEPDAGEDGRQVSSRGDTTLGLSLRQRRVGAQVRAALCQELEQGGLRDPLVQRCGFGIQEVRMSEDLRSAYVLWSALGGRGKDVERHLRSNVGRLRSRVFQHLNLPFSPVLHFRAETDKVAGHQRALDAAFERIKEN